MLSSICPQPLCYSFSLRPLVDVIPPWVSPWAHVNCAISILAHFQNTPDVFVLKWWFGYKILQLYFLFLVTIAVLFSEVEYTWKSKASLVFLLRWMWLELFFFFFLMVMEFFWGILFYFWSSVTSLGYIWVFIHLYQFTLEQIWNISSVALH